MHPSAFSQLCSDVGVHLGLDDREALETAAWVNDEKVVLVHDEDLDDGVYIYVNVGLATTGSA